MPIISSSIAQDAMDMYDGFDSTSVGIGMQNPNIYATPEYQKKKIQKLVIGGISRIVYSGYDQDPEPLCLSMMLEGQYNTILALNLHYVPPPIRKNILKFIMQANAPRIKANLPLIVNYESLKRAVPQIKGIVRRYKIVGIRVVETYKLAEWPKLIQENSKYENVYKTVG